MMKRQSLAAIGFVMKPPYKKKLIHKSIGGH